MAEETKPKTILQRIGIIIYRLGVVVLLAFIIGLILNKISATFEHDTRPAGFLRGMLQGALMPMSLPNLLVGKDVSIYSLHNTGTTYKLGYTVGTNTCGAIFFGLFFWRLTRWRAKGTTGLRDYRTTGQQDHKKTGL